MPQPADPNSDRPSAPPAAEPPASGDAPGPAGESVEGADPSAPYPAHRRWIGVIDRLSMTGMSLAALAVLAMLLVVTLEVALRSTGSQPTGLADEWSGYLLVACTFLGLAYTARVDGLVRVSLLYDRLSPKAKAGLRILYMVVALVVVGVIAGAVLDTTLRSRSFGLRSNFLSRTPIWLPQSVMVLGAVTMLLQLVAELAKAVHLLRTAPSWPQGSPGPAREGRRA